MKNFEKIIQNWFQFNPVVPNSADNCILEFDEISIEWKFKTPSPYPNNFKCSRMVSCPESKFIHYRFNRLRIDTTDYLTKTDLFKCRDHLKITDDGKMEGMGDSKSFRISKSCLWLNCIEMWA